MRVLLLVPFGAAALLAGCAPDHSPTMLPVIGVGQVVAAGSSDPYSVLYSFKGAKNGFAPFGALLDINGIFYGATGLGGNAKCGGKAYGCGTLFAVTDTGRQHVLYSPKPPAGVNPPGSLIRLRDSLYGVTAGGGAVGNCGGGSQSGCGTVFEISTSGKERTIYNFKGISPRSSDGQDPQGGLVYVDGKLYGVTFGGGAYHYGTVFEVSLAGTERVLHAFNSKNSARDGANPQAGLVDVKGTLYGTTSSGGGKHEACTQAFGNSCGTVFSITAAGQYRVLYRFKGRRDGAYPLAGLTYLSGELYGTTFFGGTVGSGCPAGCGTVFEVDPTSGLEQVIYRFQGGTDGYQPGATLLAYRGTLYGTTYLGGTGAGCSFSTDGCGTIFQITTSGVKSILHNFSGDGLPNSRLTVVNGKLYGTTPVGGPHYRPIRGCGDVFRLTL